MVNIITCRKAWFIIGLLWALSAAAQPDADAVSSLVGCANIQPDDARLACYDRIVEAVQAQQLGSTADDRRDGNSAAGTQSSPPPIEEGRGAASEPPAARAPASTRTESARGNSNRGADDGERPVTVVEVRATVPGRAVFVTSDGDTYVQTSGPMRLSLPDVPFDAALRSGMVGGVFLQPDGTRLRIRVSARD